MEKQRFSGLPTLDLQEFKNACKASAPQGKDVSTLLHKRPISVDSISDISTLQYIAKFGEHMGCHKSQGIKEISQIFSVVDEVFGEQEENENEKFEKKRDSIRNGTNGRLNAKQFDDLAALGEFWNLKILDISSNELKNVRNLGGMPYLEKINASRNLLETILEITPPVPSALKEIDFSYNKISSIVELQQYWSLTHINLSYNELTTVHGFSGLEYLQVLNLSNNKIESIEDLDCRNLIKLDLSFNRFEEITNYLGCCNLRTLNLLGNKLSTVQGLKHLVEITELDLTGNNIQDIIELEHLQSLLNLTSLKLHLNPISSVENWRLVLIHALPQIMWLDGTFIKPTDLRAAVNLFSPSFKKLSYLDHADIILGRSCQSANSIFEDYCRNRPFPPILLLVGPPRSHCHALVLLLKQKFRNKVHLGGVHSTATTMEGSNPKIDIPVSYESFQEMRNRGEFLAVSQILGRVCGFATSQIARAAEKGALLVAAVPLSTAIALRDWELKPKLILALPSTSPEFPEDQERTETIKRSVDSGGNDVKAFQRGSQVSEEEEDEELEGDDEEEYNEDHEHHLVNFAEMLSVAPSIIEETNPEKILYSEPKERFGSNDIRQHSILKSVKKSAEDMLEKGSSIGKPSIDIGDRELTSSVKIMLRQSTNHHDHVVDLERKMTSRLKSILPGHEKYQDYDDDDNDEEKEEEEDGADEMMRNQENDEEPKQEKVIEEKVSIHLPHLESALKKDSHKLSKMTSIHIEISEPVKEMEESHKFPNATGGTRDSAIQFSDERNKQMSTVKIHIRQSTFKGGHEVDLEKKNSKRLKSIGPGRETYKEVPEEVITFVPYPGLPPLCSEIDKEEEEKEETKHGDEEYEEEEDEFEEEAEEMPKSELLSETDPDSAAGVPQLTHKEAMTFSIEETKESYFQFHHDSPGFFHTIIDTANMCDSYKTVENFAMEALINFKHESMAYNANKAQVTKPSHAGSNQLDAKPFLDERMRQMRNSSALWIKGMDAEKETFQLNSCQDQSKLLFSNPPCPRNLLDPTTHKPPITLKMKRLVEMHEKRAKCATTQRNSCSLGYLDSCK